MYGDTTIQVMGRSNRVKSIRPRNSKRKCIEICLLEAGGSKRGGGKTGNHFRPRLWHIFAVARISAVRLGGRSNLGLWIFLLPGLRGPDRHRVTPYSLAWCVAFKMRCRRRHMFLANVPRQVSLAGAADGSQAWGAKALGLLFCQQALCLSA